MKNTILLILFLFVNCILQSCIRCPDVKPYCYTVELNDVSLINLDRYQSVASSDTLALDSLGILLSSDIVDAALCYQSIDFGSSLYGWSCPDSPSILNNEIDSIRITSNSDLSPRYEAGSKLNDLFYFARIVPDGICIDSIHNGYICHTIIDSSIVGYLEYIFNEELFSPELHVEPSNQSKGVFLIREVDDLILNDHVFNFEFEFKDGLSQSFQTEQVFLKY